MNFEANKEFMENLSLHYEWQAFLYPASRGFSLVWLLASTKSFSWLVCAVVGRKQTNHATDKQRERLQS